MKQYQLREGAETVTGAPLPFGGVYGWLADLAVARRAGSPSTGFARTVMAIETYYVAVPNQGQAMRTIRAYAGAGRDAKLTPIRMLSSKEVCQMGLRPGQVKRG